MRVCPDLSDSVFTLAFFFSRREVGCGGKMNALRALAPFRALALKCYKLGWSVLSHFSKSLSLLSMILFPFSDFFF